MALLYFLADAFINTFGITRPTSAGRRQAALFILGLLVLLLAGVTAVSYVVYRVTR